MKILILSCNTGEGHNSSAKALKKEMDARGIVCDVADTLSLVSEFVSRSISDLYVFSTRSSLIEYAYKFGEVVSDNLMIPGFKSPVHAANRLYSKKLYDCIIEGNYDAVICVHLFPAEALTALKHRAKLDIPSVFVMTDYTCIPFLSETELDKYVIPHEDLIEEFVEKGIPRVKILGFTDRIPEYMDACDVLLTKPGGITSTEALVKNIPLVHTEPIRGLEDYNARFFHYHRMSYSTCDIAQQARVAHRLCTDTAYRALMIEAQKRNSNPNTCADIVDLFENQAVII